MVQYKSLNIRMFQESDLQQVADILIESFKEKVEKLPPLEKDELKDYLIKNKVK